MRGGGAQEMKGRRRSDRVLVCVCFLSKLNIFFYKPRAQALVVQRSSAEQVALKRWIFFYKKTKCLGAEILMLERPSAREKLQ